jgi:hypothetical protein
MIFSNLSKSMTKKVKTVNEGVQVWDQLIKNQSEYIMLKKEWEVQTNKDSSEKQNVPVIMVPLRVFCKNLESEKITEKQKTKNKFSDLINIEYTA